MRWLIKSCRKMFLRATNAQGIALLMAMTFMTMMMFIAIEVGYNAQINYTSSSKKLNHLKAYYAARAATKLSLLRVGLYQKALKTYAQLLQGNSQILNPIWEIPFTWPPTLPDTATEIDKSRTRDQAAESLFKTQYLTTIANESGKIDINLIASPSKKVAESTRKQVLSIFTNRVAQDPDFAQNFSGKNFEKLVNNIIDWVDEDETRVEGGNEQDLYPQFDSLPPNQAFKTLKELHMVAEMEDELYNMLAERVTVFGHIWVDMNAATAEVIQSFSPSMTLETAQAIVARRNNPEEGGPFKNQDEFLSFVQGLGVYDFNPHSVPIGFEPVRIFRIQSTGQWGASRSDVEVVTYDVDNLEASYISMLDKQSQRDNKSDKKPNQSRGKRSSTGRPQVLYWREL